MRIMRISRFCAAAIVLVTLGIVLSMFGSCATTKPKEFERAGIKGSVVPVDSKGDEIVMEDKEKIIINCIPVENGMQKTDRTITVNAKGNGDFVAELRGGEYVVEVFLEGFYVRTFNIVLDRNRKENLGKIEITRIESGTGTPMRDDVGEEVITNEGDVNIQPPTQ
jgi:hypothetical protein